MQHADMPCEHSLHVTTPTPWHFVVLFPPGWEVDMTSQDHFLLPTFWYFQLGFSQVYFLNLLVVINETYMLTLALKYDKQFSLPVFMNYALIILVFVNGFTFE